MIDDERNYMTENLNDIRIPHDGEYSRNFDVAIRRRTYYEQQKKGYATRRNYIIGETKYTIRSVFDGTEKKTTTEMIRRLIDLDAENVSGR